MLMGGLSFRKWFGCMAVLFLSFFPNDLMISSVRYVAGSS
jgi:hypothetical protein